MILVQLVDHADQRYATSGDWIWRNGNLIVSVSDTGSDMSNLLVAIHEMVEAYLCRRDGIREEDVTAFDMQFVGSKGEGEPGVAIGSPYKPQHQAAESVERLAALVLGVDWNDHDNAVEALFGRTRTTQHTEG